MGKPLSLDLRERAVADVEGGLSRRQAAARFKVSAASVIRWCQRKAAGSLAPAAQGGDRKSHRIEAHADFILAAVAAAPDITLEELQIKLIEARGARFGLTTIWRFFDRHASRTKNVWPAPAARVLLKATSIGLHKRIRHVGTMAAAKMEIRAVRAS